MWTVALAAAAMLQEGPFAGASWLTVPKNASAIEGASWIWVQRPGEPLPTSANAPAGTVHLTRTWRLTERPQAATVWFRADNLCHVRINGREVGSGTDWQRPQTVDVHDSLQAGENRIEVEATNGPADTPGGANPAGFLFAGTATSGTGTSSTVVSDAAWESPDGRVAVLGGYATAPWNLRPAPIPAPAFRREFSLNGRVVKAVAKVVGLGQFDLYVNGKRQGMGILNGPWSQYDKTLYWQEFDVTKSLKDGANAIGVELGNSFYRVETPPPGRHAKGDAMPDFSGDAPYLLGAVLDVTYADGRQERVATDRAWRYDRSPYTLSHVYAGEDYDARLIDPKWNHAGYDMKGWNAPVVVDAPKAELRKMDWPLLREIQSWKPTAVKNPKPGVWSYLFPQNALAVVRFRVKGTRGAKITLKPSETITPEGEVRQLNMWGASATCDYTLRGGDAETHEWRFFYHGFQFVEVTGAVPMGKPNPQGLPVVESMELVHIRTDNPQVGDFSSSSDIYNGTHRIIDWSMRSNMNYYQTDCPQREKLGWLECDYLLFPTFAYRYDVREWFHKITRDMRDIQLPDGRVTNVAPDYLRLPVTSPYKFTIEWGAASVLLPWQAYRWYGDRRFLVENEGMMRRFVDWIDAHAVDGIAPRGLGDWYDYGHGQSFGPSRFTPSQLTSTTVWAMCADAAAGTAEALGDPAGAAKYRAMHARIKKAFLARFYDPAKKRFENTGSVQSGHAMALCAGLVPDEDRKAVLEAIVEDLKGREYQQTPGDIGHLFLIRALAEAGRSDVLHRVYSRTGVGSYGGLLAKGLTTLPETWDATVDGSNSLNHCMLGHIMEWFYGWVLGVRQTPDSVGWRNVLIAPEPGDLTNAKGKTRTPQGEITVAWTRKDGRFRLETTVPEGTQATVVLPNAPTEVHVDGKRVTTKPGVFGRPSVEIAPGKHTVEAF